MKTGRDDTCVRQMLAEARRIHIRVASACRADLETDEDLAAALAWRLAVIGEAAGRVSEQYRQQHPDLPWVQIVGMRNRLIHGYDAIDLDVVWSTVEQDLPQLIAYLESIAKPTAP